MFWFMSQSARMVTVVGGFDDDEGYLVVEGAIDASLLDGGSSGKPAAAAAICPGGTGRAVHGSSVES